MRPLQRLAALIAPPVCVLCTGNGQHLDEVWGLDLCVHCERACRVVRHPCPGCGLPCGPPAAECSTCRNRSWPFDAVFAAFEYADPVDQMITRLKFQHDLAFARVLGTLVARAWQAADLSPPDCLLPLPLHHSRLRERGFCQTTAIARHVARRLPGRTGTALPLCTGLLTRVRPTPAQSGLAAAERERNLRGAFQVRPGVRPPRRIALLDDVLTTASTASAAAEALKNAGARHVEVWCCARAIRHAHAGGGDPRG